LVEIIICIFKRGKKHPQQFNKVLIKYTPLGADNNPN